MDVQKAGNSLLHGQRHLDEVNGADRRAVVGVGHQFVGDCRADSGLRLFGRASDVWCEDDICQALQRGLQPLFAVGGLLWKDVDRGAAEPAVPECFGERFKINDTAAGGIDKDSARPHAGNLGGADHFARGGRVWYMQADGVGLSQKFVQGPDRNSISQRQLVHDVEVEHPHADRLGENGKLRANVSVANDSKRPTTHLMRAAGGLAPYSSMGQSSISPGSGGTA